MEPCNKPNCSKIGTIKLAVTSRLKYCLMTMNYVIIYSLCFVKIYYQKSYQSAYSVVAIIKRHIFPIASVIPDSNYHYQRQFC